MRFVEGEEIKSDSISENPVGCSFHFIAAVSELIMSLNGWTSLGFFDLYFERNFSKAMMHKPKPANATVISTNPLIFLKSAFGSLFHD